MRTVHGLFSNQVSLASKLLLVLTLCSMFEAVEGKCKTLSNTEMAGIVIIFLGVIATALYFASKLLTSELIGIWIGGINVIIAALTLYFPKKWRSKDRKNEQIHGELCILNALYFSSSPASVEDSAAQSRLDSVLQSNTSPVQPQQIISFIPTISQQVHEQANLPATGQLSPVISADISESQLLEDVSQTGGARTEIPKRILSPQNLVERIKLHVMAFSDDPNATIETSRSCLHGKLVLDAVANPGQIDQRLAAENPLKSFSCLGSWIILKGGMLLGTYKQKPGSKIFIVVVYQMGGTPAAGTFNSSVILSTKKTKYPVTTAGFEDIHGVNPWVKGPGNGKLLSATYKGNLHIDENLHL
jgi:hypothetical protein